MKCILKQLHLLQNHIIQGYLILYYFAGYFQNRTICSRLNSIVRVILES